MNDPHERRGRLRAACLAVLGGMLACSAPDVPSGPPPAAVLRIPGAPQVSLKVGAVVQLSVGALYVLALAAILG